MSVSDTIAQDKDSPRAYDTLRVQHNLLAAEVTYFRLNGVASTTVATAPVVATATTTSKVKTTNATVLREAGALVALAATDNYWTLTGGNLAAGSARRYLLVDTGGVASVVASSDTVIANFASTAAAIAACRWVALPANGAAIVGILSIANATNAFVPGTTLLGATGVTATYVDGSDISVPLAQLVSP